MITVNGAEARVSHEQLQYLFTLRTLGDQIADANHAVVVANTNLFKQLHQFIVTTVKISHYNSATSHQHLRRVMHFDSSLLHSKNSGNQGYTDLRGSQERFYL